MSAQAESLAESLDQSLVESLTQSQQRFQQAVLAEDIAPGLFVAEGAAVAGGFSLYLIAYRARLLAALRDNFPVLHRALGDEAFADLAHDYMDAHPSRFRSIRWLGDALTAFIDLDPGRLPHPALADVARMDWAIRGAFDAQDSSSLTLPDLAALAPADWPQQRFALVPSLRLIPLAWGVEPIWHALNDDAAAETSAPEPLPHVLLVWRPELDCLWRSASAVEAAALAALAQGATFAECCAVIAEAGEPDPATAAVGLLQRWVSDGLLARC
jgi:hypothetical protein